MILLGRGQKDTARRSVAHTLVEYEKDDETTESWTEDPTDDDIVNPD
jgi:hypothetical protein